jgi:hypothetical protein
LRQIAIELYRGESGLVWPSPFKLSSRAMLSRPIWSLVWNVVRGYVAGRDGVLGLVFLAILGLGAVFPNFGSVISRMIEGAGTGLARKRCLAILTLAGACVALRLSLLWLYPVPIPRVHDEFSNLLLADTLAHGRLANPPHAMHLYLETFHVNQFPFYVSKYPPAQGAVLALGQILGCAWIGVLFSAAGMCAAVVWMLQGWMAPRWAFLGGVLVFFHLATFSYWVNSYWGGAVPAIGGALVTGALPRIIRYWRAGDALLLAVGAAVLMNSRPMEGLFLCLPVAAVLLWGLIGAARPTRRVALRNFLLPVGLVLASAVGLGLYYNWRTTGDAFVMPYVVNEQTYVSAPTLFWMPARAPLHYENAQFDAFYNGWMRGEWMSRRTHSLRYILVIALTFSFFFLWPELCLPLVAVPWVLRETGMRFLLVQGALCVCGFFLVSYFEPHYAAPLVGTLFALVVRGIRRFRRLKFAGRPIGLAFSRVSVLAAVLFAPLHGQGMAGELALSSMDARSVFEARLKARPGKHLVLVRYSPHHIVGEEWVYNHADIDGAKVVWAREIPGLDVRPLLDYFKDRDVWLAEPDHSPPGLTPYVQ